MHLMRLVIVILAGLSLGGCASKFKTYDGPEVTSIVVNKGERKMYLLNNDVVLKDYQIGLGFEPIGDKTVEGDGKTPEGTYVIDRRNPNSQFHLSLGISYPNSEDVAQAKALGESPGGDIFIHGRPKIWQNGVDDWTWGCIAVTDREIEDIYAMVNNGTLITIRP